MAIVIVMSMAAVAALLFNRMVLNYRPIQGQGGSFSYDGTGVVTVDGPGSHRAVYASVTARGTFTMTIELTNTGPRAVKIMELPSFHPGHAYVASVEVLVGDVPEYGASPAVLRPFEPFTMGAEERRSVSYRYRFIDCEFEGSDTTPEFDGHSVSFGTGGRTSWERQRVVYEVWGVRRDAAFELPDAIVLVGGAPDQDCLNSEMREREKLGDPSS